MSKRKINSSVKKIKNQLKKNLKAERAAIKGLSQYKAKINKIQATTNKLMDDLKKVKGGK